MQKTILAAVAFATCVPLAAQDHFTASPFGFENVEGTQSNNLIGSSAMLRFQQIDATNQGSKTNRNRWCFRRDGVLPANASYGARTIDMEFIMAEAKLGSASTVFDNNYVSGTNVVAFTRKNINAPDWTAPPVSAPSTHDWVIPFDTIVNYTGTVASGNDWLWEVKVWGNDQAGNNYPMDADPVIPSEVFGPVTSTGTGCQNSGFSRAMSSTFTISNDTNDFDLVMGVSNSQVGSAAAYMLGTAQTTVLPGFCGNLEIEPLSATTIPLPNVDANGRASLNATIAYNSFLIGLSVSGQGLVIDTEQPSSIGLTEGDTTTVPADPPTTSQCIHLWANDPSASSATSGIVAGGILCLSNHP